VTTRTPITFEAASRIVDSDPEFCESVGHAILTSEVNSRHHNRCMQCAAELYRTSWLQLHVQTRSDLGGCIDSESVIKRLTRDAFRRCEIAGIIPGGLFSSVAFWILRRAVWSFIWWLIKNQFTSTEDELIFDESRVVYLEHETEESDYDGTNRY